MESIFPEGSPLAGFLEGEGQKDGSHPPSEQSSSPELLAAPSFAPFASTTLRSRLRSPTLTRLRLKINHTRTISGAQEVWTRAIDTRVSTTENGRFLDHFRYVLVASQLLEENPDHGLLQRSRDRKDGSLDSAESSNPLTLFIYKAAAATASIAFLTVWIFAWILSGRSRLVSVILILVHCTFSVTVVYFHGRHQMLRYLRAQVLESAKTLVHELQSFELASGSALSLIHEVEVVAKGMRGPSAPRLEEGNTMRRCLKLRGCLGRAFLRMSEVLNNAHTGILALVDLHDYDKFIDIYDIPREGIEQSVSVQAVDASDLESSGVLRVMGWRVSILRRAVLCSLLSLEADGDARDYSRWRSAADRMNKLCKETKINAGRILESLESLEDLALPSTPTPSSKPTNERLRTQVRKISNLSSGIKALQAKMTLLREESNVAISRADDLTDLGPSLMSQYESIGADIQTLLREWESGKAALSANIVKHERRISLATSPIIRSPGLSSTFGVLSELSSVGEGGPADALVSLSGDTSLSQRESSSPRSSMPATPSDEEIFEAIALPKRRNSLSREDRIRLMNEERVKAEERKSQRESGLNMIRELRSVINLRKKPDQAPDTDVPSN